jgi:uncharacterized LabA/DUF88 family protein
MDAQYRTVVYVDGFNFYYGQLKGTPWKWLNLEPLFHHVLGKHHNLVGIEYFTARVQPNARDPDVHMRQSAWFHAQQHVSPMVNIHYGHFLRHRVLMENADPPPARVPVWKTEEKGSDVNLALHVLNDAWMGRYDCAVVVSNDSDLATALAMVKTHHKKKIGIITPGAPIRKTSWALEKQADFVRTIRSSALRKAQLPETIPGTGLHKPAGW